MKITPVFFIIVLFLFSLLFGCTDSSTGAFAYSKNIIVTDANGFQANLVLNDLNDVQANPISGNALVFDGNLWRAGSVVSGVVWGAITGTLGNQTDLNNALNLKANKVDIVYYNQDLNTTDDVIFNKLTTDDLIGNGDVNISPRTVLIEPYCDNPMWNNQSDCETGTYYASYCDNGSCNNETDCVNVCESSWNDEWWENQGTWIEDETSLKGGNINLYSDLSQTGIRFNISPSGFYSSSNSFNVGFGQASGRVGLYLGSNYSDFDFAGMGNRVVSQPQFGEQIRVENESYGVFAFQVGKKGNITSAKRQMSITREGQFVFENSGDFDALNHGTKNQLIETPSLWTNELVMGDTSNLGAEKITNGTFTGGTTGWTLGTGWAYGTNVVTKNGAGTGTLSQTSGGMVTPLVVGEVYQLTLSITGWTEGSGYENTDFVVVPTIAGNTLTDIREAYNGTYIKTFMAKDTNGLVFTPTTGTRFTIDNVSLKKINTSIALTNTGVVSINGKTGIDGNRWTMATSTTRCYTTYTKGIAIDSNCPTS